jgi:WD40 repeat protein
MAGGQDRVIVPHTHELSSIALSPDGKTMALHNWIDKTTTLWDLATSTARATCHTGWNSSLAYGGTPDSLHPRRFLS